MAKYIKQELPDLHKTGKKRVYYRLKTEKNIDAQEFVEQICLQSPGLSRGDVARVLMHATDTLARLLSEGNAVTVDEMGVFRASVGLEADKEKETVDGDEPKRNARSLYINGVKFHPDVQFVNKTNRSCKLMKLGESRLCRSPYTPEERLAMALAFMDKNGAMKVRHYMMLTGLSHTKASDELKKHESNPTSGITSVGRLAGKVYVKNKEKLND